MLFHLFDHDKNIDIQIVAYPYTSSVPSLESMQSSITVMTADESHKVFLQCSVNFLWTPGILMKNKGMIKIMEFGK